MASKSKKTVKKPTASRSNRSAKSASKNSAASRRTQSKPGASKSSKKSAAKARSHSKSVSAAKKTRASGKKNSAKATSRPLPKKNSAPPRGSVKRTSAPASKRSSLSQSKNSASSKTQKSSKSTASKASSARPSQAAPGIQQPLFPIRRAADSSSQLQKKTVFTKPAQKQSKKPAKLSKDFLNRQKKKLEELRDHLLDQMRGVAQETLKSKDDTASSSAFGMHQADAGSDSYEQDFALSLLSQEQDALNEIQEALQRIDDGSYGVCEMSNESIPLERLEAIPFARYTVVCQSQIEKENRNRNKWEAAAPFGESAEGDSEDEDEVDEEEKLKSRD